MARMKGVLVSGMDVLSAMGGDSEVVVVGGEGGGLHVLCENACRDSVSVLRGAVLCKRICCISLHGNGRSTCGCGRMNEIR